MAIRARSTRVLVVGGGIAGTVAAIALTKAGFAPIVAQGAAFGSSTASA